MIAAPSATNVNLLDAPRCALLVIDKQRWYLDPSVSPFLRPDDADEADAEIRRHDAFIEHARAAGVPVLWTTMTEGDEHAPANVLARWARRPHEPRLRRDDKGFEFAGIAPAADEAVSRRSIRTRSLTEGSPSTCGT